MYTKFHHWHFCCFSVCDPPYRCRRYKSGSFLWAVSSSLWGMMIFTYTNTIPMDSRDRKLNLPGPVCHCHGLCVIARACVSLPGHVIARTCVSLPGPVCHYQGLCIIVRACVSLPGPVCRSCQFDQLFLWNLLKFCGVTATIRLLCYIIFTHRLQQ